jgi:hypothetical protein
MHRTSTTTISDALQMIYDIDEALVDVEWMPIEQLSDLLMRGTILVQGIFEKTGPEMYDPDETEYLFQMVERLNEFVDGMHERSD